MGQCHPVVTVLASYYFGNNIESAIERCDGAMPSSRDSISFILFWKQYRYRHAVRESNLILDMRRCWLDIILENTDTR
jgi:hypothetical protein